MFSNKQYDYLWLRNNLVASFPGGKTATNIVYSDDLPKYNRNTEPFNTVESIINVPYFFFFLLVGFIEALGCFSVYKLKKDSEYLVA
jgi:hypothetical protein